MEKYIRVKTFGEVQRNSDKYELILFAEGLYVLELKETEKEIIVKNNLKKKGKKQ